METLADMQAHLEDLLKGRRRTEPQWQRTDGSWWERGPNGKPRRVREGKPEKANADAPAAPSAAAHPAHDHLDAAEKAFRDSGHHDHANAVARLRTRVTAAARDSENEAFDPMSIDPIKTMRHGGADSLRTALKDMDSEQLLKVARAWHLADPTDARRMRGQSRERLVQFILDGAEHELEVERGAVSAGR